MSSFTRLGVESSIKYRAISGVVSDSMESIGYGPVSQAHLDEAIRIETSGSLVSRLCRVS